MKKAFSLIAALLAISLTLTSCEKKQKSNEETVVLTFFDHLQNNSLDVVAEQIKKGQNVNEKDANGFAPIFYTVIKDPKAAEDALLALESALQNNEEAKAWENIQTLWSLSVESPDQLFTLLTENGAELNVKSPAGKSLFLYACLLSKSDSIVKAVSKATEDKTETLQASFPQSIFSFAVFLNKNPEVIKTLAKTFKNVNEQNENGTTPIMWACMYQDNTAVIDALVELGASLNDKSHLGSYSPIDWAVACNRSDAMKDYLKKQGAHSTKPKNTTAVNTEFEKLESEKVFVGASITEQEFSRFLAEANRYRGRPFELDESEVLGALETKEQYDEIYESFQTEENLSFNQSHNLFTYDEIVEMINKFKSSALISYNTKYIIIGASTKPSTYFDSTYKYKIRFGLKSYDLIPNEAYDPWAETESMDTNSRTADYYYWVGNKKEYFSSEFTEFYSVGYVFVYEVETQKIYSDFSYAKE